MLRVTSLCKAYITESEDVVQAAHEVSFEVPEGKMFTLLGPSGCGKTTTLRSVAGLEKPDSGEIVVDGTTIYSSERRVYVPPNRRGFGMVFQSYAIWPHMTVFENAAFPLRTARNRKKFSKQRVRDAVMRVLETVALDGLENRKATRLSGGQQQRLALARALITGPRLLLLDEPLSNLDAKLREKMRFELKRLQEELNITTVYVTHDQSEALALSHRIAVMRDGRIAQLGSPREIYDRPADRFVADFVGTTNFLNARVLGRTDENGGYMLRTQFGDLAYSSPDRPADAEDLVVSVRPEHVQVSADRSETANSWPAVVEAQIFLGDYQDLQLRLGNELLLARAHPSLKVSPGDQVYVGIESEHVVICHS